MAETLRTKELRARGWTDAAISKFLGKPDDVERGTIGGWSYSACLYSASRVTAAEGTPEFREWAKKRDARSAAGKKGRERALAAIAAWTPYIRRIELTQLRQFAVNHYNSRQLDRAARGDFDDDDRPRRLATVEAPSEFLSRIMVNFLRHSASSYDAKLRKAERLGARGQELVRAVKARVLQAIAAAYPELATECARQEARRV